MESSEVIKILLNQVKERDDLIKTLSENIIKLSDAYIIKDKEKDKRHTKTIIIILSLTIGFCAFFTGSYFFSNYNDHSATSITGDGNSTSNISGNDNTNNQNKGGNE